jgi:hypothetical protein
MAIRTRKINSPTRIPWGETQEENQQQQQLKSKQCANMCGAAAILSINVSRLKSLDLCWNCYLREDPGRFYKPRFFGKATG